MEAGVITGTQQQQQVQTGDLALIARPATYPTIPSVCGDGVEGLELLEVACERVGVLQSDADQGAAFENMAPKEEKFGIGRLARDECVEFQQCEFAFR